MHNYNNALKLPFIDKIYILCINVFSQQLYKTYCIWVTNLANFLLLAYLEITLSVVSDNLPVCVLMYNWHLNIYL